MSTTINDIQEMAGYQVDDKAFLAFERRSNTAGVSGVYFHVFDKKNGTAVQNPETVIANARKVIDSSVYNDRDLFRIFIYSNKAGTNVTITLVTTPINNFSEVHTGRIVNGNYVACSSPARVRGTLKSFLGLYYDDDTKNKFILFSSGAILPEAH
jgi:hypothetical protein